MGPLSNDAMGVDPATGLRLGLLPAECRCFTWHHLQFQGNRNHAWALTRP
jgi:hypothetical protein